MININSLSADWVYEKRFSVDIEVVKKSFFALVKEEISYRPERKIESPNMVLKDIIDTALLIAKKDILKTEDDKAKFSEINSGINQFRHFVFDGKFEIE